MENLQRTDWYDDSEQGRKAIAIGIKNTPEGWANYDWTKAESADFDWPDLEEDDVGKLKPWLCLQVKEDGTLRGWQDLNAIPDGGERKLEACARCLGMPESVSNDYDEAIALIETIRDADDLDAEAKKHGFKSNAVFSYEDHVEAVETRWEEEKSKAWGATQDLVDDQMDQLKEQMNSNIDAVRDGGELDPVQGVTLEDWAAANAKIVSGTTIEEILGVLQLEKPAWDEVNAEWNARMSRDTTAAIATVYGNAFQDPNIGKFAGVGPATPAGDGEPCDFETWVKVGVHMNKGTEQGLDPQAILKSHGMSLNDWSAAGAYWGVEFQKNLAKYFDQETKFREKYEKEYAGGSVGDDIDF